LYYSTKEIVQYSVKKSLEGSIPTSNIILNRIKNIVVIDRPNLESVYAGDRIMGSNPILSAI
tara:strand:+ start:327 stop:512 length:186 start_codon:yes stop_codon:yes gene_type:complete